MIIVLSPAKTLDMNDQAYTNEVTEPDFVKDAKSLNAALKKFKVDQIAELMEVSEKLANETHDKIKNFKPPFTPDNAKPAILTFKGDVYQGLSADDLSADDLDFAQQHIRILSGLYGLLRPLDLIQPYRLEMGRKLANRKGDDLYAFWGDRISKKLNDAMADLDSDELINLASNEYFKAIRPKPLKGRIVTIQFKDEKNGKYRVLGLFAKRARGMMSRFATINRVTKAEDLKSFNEAGYRFMKEMSSDDEWVFGRKQP